MTDTWKYWPQSWYAIAHSRSLKRGQSISGELAGRAWILYRGHSGALHAMNAYCPHMGAHLRSAHVQEDHLICALHARAIRPCPHENPAWPCHEQAGLIWLHPPVTDPAPLPFAQYTDAYHWLHAGPQRIAADWRAMICNGFDLAHMRVVHQRDIIGTPHFVHQPDRTLQMTYQTRILERGGLSSRLMKALSGGRLELIHTCAGSSILVQSRVGRFQSAGIFALLPQQDSRTPPEARHTLAYAAVGIPRAAPFAPLQLRLARTLYLAFLRKDFAVVEHMRLNLEHIDDPGVQAVTTYQSTLNDLENP